MDETITQAILEGLSKRAVVNGDDFQLKGSKVPVRCFNPDKHKNGDAHPSAIYYLGKYLYCPVCGFKEGQKRIAERMGIGEVEGGLTLSALAIAKGLPVELLQVWGWRTQSGRDNRAKVLIPWYDENGVLRNAPAYHVRHYINKDEGIGPRFTWDLPKGTKLKPYGFWRFREFMETARLKQIPSYIIITESEIDTLTCWLHDIPACAIGGAEGFKDEWSQLFMAFQKVVIAQEPGSPGEIMIKRIAKAFNKLNLEGGSKIPVILACPFPETTKDTNALHLSVNGDKTKFQELLKDLVSKSVSMESIQGATEDQENAERNQQEIEEFNRLMGLAQPLLADPGILHKAILTVESQGVVGERRNIGLIHLALRSRALKRPVNIEVNSPSSTGKTHVVLGTLSLEDPSAYYELTAGSEKALIYLDEPLKNRVIYVQEPEGLTEGVGAAVIKSLVWEGRLKYDTVVKEEGELVGKYIEKEGPTGLIVCTTHALEEQISNRLLRVEVDASEEQTKRILMSIAQAAAGKQTSVDVAPWHALSSILGKTAEINIVYGPFLAEKVSAATLRIRRDFTHLLTLIGACAIEYRFQRTANPAGQIQATAADYAMAYALVADTFRDIQAEGITPHDRAMVNAVIEETTPPGGKPSDSPITQAALRTYMKLSKSSTSYRVKRLLKLGYLANLENRKGMEMKLVPGAPLPDEPAPLPSPCDLAEYLAQSGFPQLVIPWVDPVTGNRHDCREHLDKKYLNTPTTSSAEYLEPCPRSEASSGVRYLGFTAIEPIEPPIEQGSRVQGVQTKLNPDHASVNPRLEETEGSKPSGREKMDGVKNTSNQSSLDPDDSWGEI